MTTVEPTLTDARGLGGIIAQAGFDYQVWDTLIRLPMWLKNPTFEGVIFEGLEDVEARFFAPHTPNGHFLDRFQSKSGVLTRSEIIEVLNSFAVFEDKHRHVARVQTLVTPSLPPTLTWIARDPMRVHRARRFYSPFADIQAASDEKLQKDITEEFGAKLGTFFASSVEISLRNLPDRSHAEMGFAASMEKAFPSIGFTSRKLRDSFSALSDFIAQSRGMMLTRHRLLVTLEEALGSTLNQSHRLSVHIRSDRNSPDEAAVEIDASKFSSNEGRFPTLELWQSDLLKPLALTACWAHLNQYQHISLSGSYRLTTAFAFGWSFRSATGFEIDIPTRQEVWATNNHPTIGATHLPWCLTEPADLLNERLVVSVGILRDPITDILKNLGIQSETNILSAFLPVPLTTGVEAQAFVQIVKSSVSQAATRLQPSAIDLYYVGPAAFAVALGHRWNAFPPTQLHEFISTHRCYVPTLIIST